MVIKQTISLSNKFINKHFEINRWRRIKLLKEKFEDYKLTNYTQRTSSSHISPKPKDLRSEMSLPSVKKSNANVFTLTAANNELTSNYTQRKLSTTQKLSQSLANHEITSVTSHFTYRKTISLKNGIQGEKLPERERLNCPPPEQKKLVVVKVIFRTKIFEKEQREA